MSSRDMSLAKIDVVFLPLLHPDRQDKNIAKLKITGINFFTFFNIFHIISRYIRDNDII